MDMNLPVPVTRAAQPSLVYCPHPLLATANRRLEYSTFLQGESIAGYLERLDIRFGSQPVFLRLNGQLIHRDEWALTFPKQGDLLVIRARLRGPGGSGGKNPLRTVLSIAVLIAAVAITGPSGLALTGWQAVAVQAVIVVGGSLLINAILPPPSPNLAQASRLDNPSPTYSLTGGSNRARPYEPLPVVMGKHRVFPDYGAKPYTEFEGDDQYLYQVFHFGLSDLVLNDFRIGSTPIEDFEDVTIQQSALDGKLTLFPANVDSIAGAELTHAAGWISRTSSINAHQLAVDLTGTLFYAGNNGIEPASVSVELQYRKVGAADWLPFVYGEQTLFHTHYWSAGRYQSVNDEQVWVQAAYGSVDPNEHAPGEFDSNSPFLDENNNPIGLFNTWRYRPYTEITPGAPDFMQQDAAPAQGYQVQSNLVTITSASRKLLRLTYKIDVADAQYDVRVRRVTEDSTDARRTDQFLWSQLRTYQPDTADYTGQKRVAVKIKASGQLQGTLDQFNALASAQVKVWDGSAWIYQETSNPAWSLFAAMEGKYINGRRAWGCGLPLARIDMENLKAFGAWCDSKALTFDGVFDGRMNCLDMLNAIARCGRGSVSLASGKYGVVWDAPALPVVAHFGLANIKAGSFRVKWVSEKLADEIVVKFINEDLDWQQDLVRAPVPGVVSPSSPLEVDLFGCKHKDMAGREANLIAAAQKYRRRFVTFESDFEGLTVNRGDVVLLSHELFAAQAINAWGYSGRLVAGTNVQLTLGSKVTMSVGQPNYVGVRYPDGTFHIRQVNYLAGEVDVITFAVALPSAPGADPDSPVVDYLWFFGLDATGPAKKFKVHDVTPLSDKDARLTLVDENPAYYAAELNPFNYTPPAGFVGQLPVISDFQVAEELVRVGNALAVRLSLSWNVTGVYDHANVRAGVNGLPLAEMGTTRGRSFDFSVPPQGTVELEVVAVHPLFGGVPSGTVRTNYTLTALEKRPSDVPWFVIDGDKLTWGGVSDLDLAGYRIKFQYGANQSWGDANPLHEGLVTASPFTMVPRPTGPVTIMIKAVDTLGVGNNELTHESEMPALIVTDLGDQLVANVVETINLKTLNWPGSKVHGTVDGANDIVADDAGGLMWNPDESAAMWTLDSNPMWHATVWKDMYYLTQIGPHQAGAGSTLTLDHQVEGAAYAIEYRRNGPGPMWTQDSELMWSADDSNLMWHLPPGDFPRPMWSADGNPMWQADPDALMWHSIEGGYQIWPGSAVVFNEPYDFRVSTAFGPTRGKIRQMIFTIDMPDIVERLNDIVIAAPGGTRLPITETYRQIKNVLVTVQTDGNGAVGARVEDKNATIGPLIKTINDAGAVVAGKTDATIQGY